MTSGASPVTSAEMGRTLDAGPPRWSLSLRIAFRFAFSYFLLYCAPFPLMWIPYGERAGQLVEGFWHALVPWVAAHVLHLPRPITVFENGSGDTTYNWVLVGCFLVIAGLATVLWSVLDRKRPSYDRLYRWSRLYLRLWLASILCSYGASKVIQLQFSPPLLSALIVPYGQHSPMGLLWTFMGLSKAYNFFAGSAEMLAGILLLIPRFTTLGALLCVAVMSNVFMLNMSYDVPVKLFSFHLLVAALVLAGPDLGNLAQFFVFKRAARLTIDRPFFSNRRLNLAGLILQLLFAAFLVGTDLAGDFSYLQSEGANRSVLYGVWSVSRANVDWKQVVFDDYNVFAVQSREGSMQYYSQKTNAQGRSIAILGYRDPHAGGVLRFIQTPPNQLRLWGHLGRRRIVAVLQRVDESRFLLTHRGFHWISEHPFNR
ncbi:MAG: hypothetical protein WBE83_05860 [Candidatus Cybelea sp.]|jgi:uncharacterized membrane protein YphA (DoxX/SURF4 family)